jgi:ubiquinone/menaquinone biosynthesis C-methylase UbiE
MEKIAMADWTLPEIAFENNELNKGYFETGTYVEKPEYYKLKEAFEFILKEDSKRPMEVLDIGCGSGWHALYFDKEGIGKEIIFNGADLSQSMCENAKKNFSAGNFFVGNIEEGSLGEYDIVFESAVIEILSDWKNGLSNMLQSSRKWFIAHRLFFVEELTKTTQVETYLQLPDIRHEVGMKEVNEILKKEGFEMVKKDVWQVGSYNMGTFIMRRKQCL